MKTTKFLAIGLALAAFTVTSCDIAKPYESISGIDSSKAKPANLTLDTDNTSSTGVSVYWDGTEAVQAGALSFTTQLVEEIDGAGDNYNSKVSKTVMSTDEVGNINDAATFTGLKTGDRYYVRVRANYAYSVYSEWVYLMQEDAIIQISVGNGIVISEFVAPQDFTATSPSYSKIIASWTMIGPAEGYEVGIKKSSGDWGIDEVTTAVSHEFKALTENTSYDVRVRAFRTNEDGTKEYTDYSTINNVSTPVKPTFDPQIKDGEQLQRFFTEIAAVAGEADTYTLAADIDMAEFPTEGTATFAGTFDGAGHKIKNLTLTGTSIFGTNMGTIKNLVIDSSCNITAIPGTYGIIANLNAGTIENCTNNADIEFGDYGSQTFLGAIVGGTSGLVKNCTNNGNININAATTTSNSAFAGVVGIFEGEKGKVAVTGCKNTGKINYTVSGTPKNPIIGGVVGCTLPHATGKGKGPAERAAAAPNVGKVTDCENTGAITVKWDTNNTGSYTNLGGVVGYIEGDVENCTNKGAIKFNTDTDPAAINSRPSVGGVAGYIMYSAKNLHNYGKVEINGCFAAGTDGAAAAGSMMQPCFGGVIGGIGYAYIASVESDEVCEGICNHGELNFEVVQKIAGGTKSNTGAVIGYCSVTTVKDCHNYAKARLCPSHKTNYVGGVIGLGYSLTVSDCTNEAELTFSGRASELSADLTNYFAYQTYAGGIIGYTGGGCKFTNCINKGAITQEDLITTSVLSYLGGINGSYASKIEMEDCKNLADINYTATASIILGGVSGAFNGNMTNCSNEGKISAPKGATPDSGAASGKESEIGGIVGYANIVAKNCTNKGEIETAAAGSYAGGLFGGMGLSGANSPYASLFRQIESCTVDCTINGAATKGSIAGRFRDKDKSQCMYYKNMTLGAGVAGLPVIGTTNGNNSMIEGDCPTEG